MSTVNPSPVALFEQERREMIGQLGADAELQQLGPEFINKTAGYKYCYNFTWLGRPIIQFPQDILAMQEIIWSVRPDVIVETGIAHGGSLVLYASMLELMGEQGKVIGVDVDIRPHNRSAIQQHPMSRRIEMIEGSSVDPEVFEQVSRRIADARSVLVVLDSNHCHDHVLQELQLYSPLVTRGSYLVVFDTVVEDMHQQWVAHRPWGRGNNPKTAVREFLRSNDRFAVDYGIQHKLLITVAPEGYLRCVKD